MNKNYLFLILGLLNILLSHPVNAQSFRNKIGIGIGGGYKSEFNTIGLCLDWEPLRNIKVSASSAFSNRVPAGYTLGIKYFIKDYVLSQKNPERENDILLSPLAGVSYMGITGNTLAVDHDGTTTFFDFPNTGYIMPMLGVRYMGLDLADHKRMMGAEVYFCVYYRYRVSGGDIVYQSGPAYPSEENKINRISRNGLGIGLTLVFDLRVASNRKYR